MLSKTFAKGGFSSGDVSLKLISEKRNNDKQTSRIMTLPALEEELKAILNTFPNKGFNKDVLKVDFMKFNDSINVSKKKRRALFRACAGVGIRADNYWRTSPHRSSSHG